MRGGKLSKPPPIFCVFRISVALLDFVDVEYYDILVAVFCYIYNCLSSYCYGYSEDDGSNRTTLSLEHLLSSEQRNH